MCHVNGKGKYIVTPFDPAASAVSTTATASETGVSVSDVNKQSER